jgi:hypothetical protein
MTEAQVLEIRRLRKERPGLTNLQIAEMVGTTQRRVESVAYKEAWKGIP